MMISPFIPFIGLFYKETLRCIVVLIITNFGFAKQFRNFHRKGKKYISGVWYYNNGRIYAKKL